MAKNDAEKQGMMTNVTSIQNQNADTVLQSVRQLAEVHHKSSIMLVAGICQFLIVRAYHSDDNQRWNLERSRDFLKVQLNERGLKQAMTYRYIATGLELARAIVRKFGLGTGVMGEIFLAKHEQEAHKVIMRCVADQSFLPAAPTLDWLLDGEKKPRLSLDVLRVNLGLDKLDPTKQPGYVAPAAVPGNGLTPAATVPATKASPASIAARLKADPDILKEVPQSVILGAVDKVVGREIMAERLISLCTLDECIKLQTAINDRMKALSEAPKEPVAEPVPAPVTEEPVAEDGTEVKTTRAQKRAAARKAKAA